MSFIWEKCTFYRYFLFHSWIKRKNGIKMFAIICAEYFTVVPQLAPLPYSTFTILFHYWSLHKSRLLAAALCCRVRWQREIAAFCLRFQFRLFFFVFFFQFRLFFFSAPANLSPGTFGGTANPLFASKWNQKLFLVSICALPNRLIKSRREKEAAAAAAEQAQHKEKEAAAAAEQALSEADTKNTSTNTNTNRNEQRQNNESAIRCAHSLHSPLSLSLCLTLLRLLGLQIFVLLTATASKSTSTATATATPTPTAASQLGRISFLKTLRHEAAI